jgi:hypothetical protein
MRFRIAFTAAIIAVAGACSGSPTAVDATRGASGRSVVGDELPPPPPLDTVTVTAPGGGVLGSGN